MESRHPYLDIDDQDLLYAPPHQEPIQRRIRLACGPHTWDEATVYDRTKPPDIPDAETRRLIQKVIARHDTDHPPQTGECDTGRIKKEWGCAN